MSMVLSFPSDQKPMDRPSADQNGEEASSVPLRGCATEVFSRRTQSSRFPLASTAVNAREPPSGGRAGGLPKAPLGAKRDLSGGGISETITSAGDRATRK